LFKIYILINILFTLKLSTELFSSTRKFSYIVSLKWDSYKLYSNWNEVLKAVSLPILFSKLDWLISAAKVKRQFL